MKDFPFIIFIMFFGLYLILFTCHYKIEEFRYNSTILSITEAAKVAGFQSLDRSVRAETGTVEITSENFEMSFEEKFRDTVNVKLDNPRYSYDYLRAKNGTIMAIRVIVTDETNTQYQATYVSDIFEGENNLPEEPPTNEDPNSDGKEIALTTESAVQFIQSSYGGGPYNARYDHTDGNGNYVIQVSEYVDHDGAGGDTGHTVTLDWFVVNPETGEYSSVFFRYTGVYY